MFVNRMEAGSLQEQVISQPSWDVVKAGIGNLDGGVNDGISLVDTASGSYMGIAGGEGGLYVVAGHLRGFGSYICASGEQRGTPKDVAVAGDDNTYASENVVGVEVVLEAAKAFYERGVLAESLKWEKQRR